MPSFRQGDVIKVPLRPLDAAIQARPDRIHRRHIRPVVERLSREIGLQAD